MLKSKSVANLIQTTLNNNDKDEKFRVVYELGNYKGAEINCLLKQGKGTITPIANYTNIKTPFRIEIITPVQCGKERIDTIIDVVNDCIMSLNGKVKSIDDGKAVFLFNPIEIGDYEVRASAGQSVLIKVEFFVEYSSNVGTKYEMALISFDFDSSGANTKYFDSQESQTTWFYDKKDDFGNFSEILTPNINSLLISQQRYINSLKVDESELLMKNYAIIRETKNNGDVNHYYYYITNSNIDQYNMITVDLKMDTVQTIYFNPKLEIADCMINKAHLDRIRPNYEDNVSFYLNYDETSPLFEREQIREVAKRPVKKQELHFAISNKNYSDTINDWFAKNVSHWIYYYMSGGKTYLVRDYLRAPQEVEFSTLKYTMGELSDTSTTSNNNRTDSSVVVLCAPVYKGKNKIYLPYKNKDGSIGYMAWDMASIPQFLNDNAEKKIDDKTNMISNNGYANVFAIKKSILPPFAKNMSHKLTATSVDADLYYEPGNNDEPYVGTDGFYGVFDNIRVFANSSNNAVALCFGQVEYQDLSKNNNMYIDFDMYDPLITYSDISNNKTSTSDLFKYGIEPKLLNEDYSNYRLYIGGNTYDLPVSKTSAKPNFIYKEILSPDITKALLIYDVTNSKESSNVFTKINQQDFTGFMINIDLSLWFSNDSLDSYLASNKNNLQIMQNNQKSQMTTSQLSGYYNLLSSGAGALKSGDYMGVASSFAGSIVSLGNLEIQQATERMNYNLTLDNMAQSPQSLSSLNSNALLIQSVDDLGIYIELQQPLSIEQEKIVNSFKMFGYTLGKIGNIREYDNMREDYNYIEANIEYLSGINISEPIRSDLRERFVRGIRFWKGDKVNYDLPNKEKWVN